MIILDDKFKLRNIVIYPPENDKIFEEFFYDKFIEINPKIDRIYLPIFWTNYYISKNYGNGDLTDLQKFLNSLDRSKKYFTIVQYDDNILNEINDLDILIFSQGGYGKNKEKSYVIPLNCKCTFIPNANKDILASFVGKKTHAIRNEMFNVLHNKSQFFLSDTLNYNEFQQIMCRSIFSLCPRGYGLTSFRIYESLCASSIPVYIYDEPFIPFKNKFSFEDIGILIHYSDISNIPNILLNKTNYEILQLRKNGEKILNEYFHYDACFQKIIEILKEI